MPVKRDWIVRMIDIFQALELGILYNPTSIRDFLRAYCNDSISAPTAQKLLSSIIKAQEEGLQFRINKKIRRLIEKKTASKDSLYELIEED